MESIQAVNGINEDCGFCPLVSLFDKEGCEMVRKKCCKKYKKTGKHCKSCPKI